MVGEKATNRALQHEWKGALGLTDSVEVLDRRRVVVIGIGGVGNNTVTQLTKMGIKNAYTIAVNTDSLHLNASQADEKILIGEKLTQGLGTRGNTALGKSAIKETQKQLEKLLAGVEVVFVVAGLGGGTGTGAAPVVAEIASEKGALTIGMVVKPIQTKRKKLMLGSAFKKLRRECNTVVVIDCANLMKLEPQLPIDKIFKIADQVLANMIKSMIETISAPSLINLNFIDFKTVVKHGGIAAVGIGESNAPNRAEEAAHNALRSPLLNTECARATGALIHVTGDNQMTIEEANRVGEIVTEMMNNNAQVIWGANADPELNGKIKVTLVMTGINPPSSSSDLSSIAPQLFNLEPPSESEKKLQVNLGLYQLESFEH